MSAEPGNERRLVRGRWTAIFFIATMSQVLAGTVDFDKTPVGSLPAGWVAGSTGSGSDTPRWAVETDPTAPSRPNVLKQTGSGRFPWAVDRNVRFENGFVEVKFKPVSGTRIRVLLNGKTCIELDDRNISGPGAVGVWTKADSVTAFDDFAWGETGKQG